MDYLEYAHEFFKKTGIMDEIEIKISYNYMRLNTFLTLYRVALIEEDKESIREYLNTLKSIRRELFNLGYFEYKKIKTNNQEVYYDFK